MGYRLGVDLGTTYTSAAISRGGRAEPVSLGDHAHEIPSVVYLRPDGGYVVGDAAVAREADQPDRVAREFKRRIGDDASIFLGGVPTSAHALTGVMLRFVVQLVTERQGGPPDQVVVTCPANWGPFRREILEHAVELGGVQGGLLCTEPEAAALQFGSTDRLADGDVIAVYDLGGGTFDAALLRRDGAALSFAGRPEGIEQLGGLDFDSALFGHVVSQLGLEGRDPDDPELTRGLSRLRHACALAKERLSYDVDTAVPVDIKGAVPSVRVTRAELEELIAPLIGETIDCLERVVERGGVAADELSAVLLVGGSARIPLVRQLLTERLGRPLPPSPQPKLCVALGASLSAAEPTPPAPAPAASARTVGPPPAAPVAPAAQTLEEPTAAPAAPAFAGDRRSLLYAVAGGLLAVAALGTSFLLQPDPDGTPMAWDGQRVVGDQLPEGVTSAQVRLAGQDLAGARPVTRQGFEPPGVLLAGPAEVALFADDAGEEPLETEFYVEGRSLGRSLLTVPGIAAVLGILYAFAYGETLLRGVRRRDGDVRAAEVLGMTGVGAVLGGVVAVAGWMSGRLPQPGAITITVVLLAAAGGLLSFAVAARTARRSETLRSASPTTQ